MSKWRLPTQKGTELWPDNKAGPTIIRIEGVEPGSVEARAMVRQFAPQISHFQRTQAQKYSLSTVDNYRAHAVYPDLKLTYTNMAGQERVDIKVTGKTRGKMSRPTEEFYDFVLLDIYVPDDLSQYIYAMGYLTTPLLQEITPGSDTQFPGVALNDMPELDRMLNAPSTNIDELTVIDAASGGRETYRSFIIDLRPARGLSAVIVDLHAHYEGGDILPLATHVWNATLLPIADPPPAPPPLGSPGNIYTPGISSNPGIYTPPTITFNVTTLRWEFTANSDVQIVIDNGPDGSGTLRSWHSWEIVTAPGYLPAGSISSVPCEIQATLFKSAQRMDVLNIQTTSVYSNYLRWAFADIARPGHLVLKSTGIAPLNPPFTTDLFVRRNVPKLGTFIVDQKRWSMSFASP